MLDARTLTNEELLVFDRNMLKVSEDGLHNMLQLLIDTWAEVLRELEIRGFVELLSGSYDDLSKAKIRRLPADWIGPKEKPRRSEV